MGGFVPIGTTDGADYHGKLRNLLLDGDQEAHLGDMVVADGTGVAADTVQRVNRAADGAFGNTLLGAIVEFLPDFTDEGSLIRNFHPAGTTIVDDQNVRIAFGSDVLFSALDGTGDADGTSLGNAGDLAGTAGGDDITGISGQNVATDALASTNALIIVRLSELEGDNNANVYGVAGETRLVVRINEGGTT